MSNPGTYELDDPGRRKSHRSHTQDWKWDWDRVGGPGLTYVGGTAGWYMPTSWSEQPDFDLENEGETLRGLYLVQAEESRRVKIGWSADVYTRLDSLRTGSPERLRLIAVLDVPRSEEKLIHDRLGQYRVHGEWFLPEVLDEL